MRRFGAGRMRIHCAPSGEVRWQDKAAQQVGGCRRPSAFALGLGDLDGPGAAGDGQTVQDLTRLAFAQGRAAAQEFEAFFA